MELQQRISGGIHNILLERRLREEAGRHYDTRFDLAFTSLMDEGIIMSMESKREKKHVVNFDELDEAQKIINSETSYKSPTIIQPFIVSLRDIFIGLKTKKIENSKNKVFTESISKRQIRWILHLN